MAGATARRVVGCGLGWVGGMDDLVSFFGDGMPLVVLCFFGRYVYNIGSASVVYHHRSYIEKVIVLCCTVLYCTVRTMQYIHCTTSLYASSRSFIFAYEHRIFKRDRLFGLSCIALHCILQKWGEERRTPSIMG